MFHVQVCRLTNIFEYQIRKLVLYSVMGKGGERRKRDGGGEDREGGRERQSTFRMFCSMPGVPRYI